MAPPAVAAIVERVDLTARRVVVRPPRGWWSSTRDPDRRGDALSRDARRCSTSRCSASLKSGAPSTSGSWTSATSRRAAPSRGRLSLRRRRRHGAEAGASSPPWTRCEVRRAASCSCAPRVDLHAIGGGAARQGRTWCSSAGTTTGVDERVRAELVDEELSIGDYVLTGGELPALVVLDAGGPAAAGSPRRSGRAARESLPGRLDYPQYTRPAEFRGSGAGGPPVRGPRPDRPVAAARGVPAHLARRPDLLRPCR